MPTKTRINGENYSQLPRLVSDDIILKGLSNTPGAPAGYGDLASAVGSAVGLKKDFIQIDMHYGALMGIGARTGELFSQATFSLSSTANKGDVLLQLSNASSGLIVGQLIAVKTDDGYYTHLTTSITGGAVGISPPLKAEVSDTSAAVGTFYNNESHPSVYGYRCIADYAVRSAGRTRKLENVFWLNKNSGSSTITNDTSNTAFNMGSSVVPAKNVSTSTVATQGAFYVGSIRGEGDFVFDVQTYSSSAVKVFVAINNVATYEWDIHAGYAGLSSLRFTTFDQYQRVTIRVCAVGASATLNVAESVKIYQEFSSARSLDYGKHVLLGDSWFAQTGFYQRLKELLPNATIVNKAVGGRKASNILLAFNDDVTEPYDFIWCICGTNDYYTGVSKNDFESNVANIKGLSINNGANFILINSSVGSADNDATRFDLSRQYAKLTDFNCSSYLQEYTLSFGPVTVAASGTAVLSNFGSFDPQITITGYYVSGSGVFLRHKSSITGGGTSVLTIPDNTLSTATQTFNVGPSRFFELFASNSSGAPITYTGYLTYLK